MTDLEKLKEIYLDPTLSEEEREDNAVYILKWEKALIESKNFDSWAKDPITSDIFSRARTSYVEFSRLLIENRELTEKERMSIYARQDAMLWILSLKGGFEQTLNSINKEIQIALEKSLQN